MKYIIVYEKSIQKEIKRLDAGVQTKIHAAIATLADNPLPDGCRKMIGYARRWRIRIGDYRIVYEIEKEIVTVHIIKIGHRKDVYRG